MLHITYVLNYIPMFEFSLLIRSMSTIRCAEIKCQITKYQMCMGCLACESVCAKGAISIVIDREGMKSYKIHDSKCVRCGECIGHFDGGCYMRRVMTIKR